MTQQHRDPELPPAPSAAAVARRRHLRAAGVNALIALVVIGCTSIWVSVFPRSQPDAVVWGLGVIAYAMLAIAVLRLIAAALAWPR